MFGTAKCHSGSGPRQVHHVDFHFSSAATRQRCCLDADNDATLQSAPFFGVIPLERVGMSLHVGGRWRGNLQQLHAPFKLLQLALGSFAVALGDLAHAGGACVDGQTALRIHFSVSPRWLRAAEGALVSTFTPLPDSQDNRC